MSKLKPYPKYKDSGVEWLGEIPEGWEVRKLGYLGNFKKGRSISKGDLTDDGEPVILYGDIYTKYQVKTEKLLRRAPKPIVTNAERIKKHDILFTGSGETKEEIGKCVVYLGNKCGYAGGDTIIFTPKPLIDSVFLSYLMYSSQYLSVKASLAKGQIVVHIYSSGLKNIPVVLPSRQDQDNIVIYLDQKTSLIDKYIKKLKKQIKLLKEYRQKIISQAVTCGLTEDGKLRKKPEWKEGEPVPNGWQDSGVEWLGLVPEGWMVGKIKYLYKIGRGRVIAKTELDEQGAYPVYSSQTKNNGILGFIDTFDYDYTQLTWTTDGANAGTVFLRKGKYNCTNVCGTLCPKSGSTNNEFNKYALEIATPYYKRPDTNGAKIMNNEMADIFIAQPPLGVQTQIVNYLSNKTTQIDPQIKKIEKQIEFIKEYKQSLISKVVTGKAKV